MAAFLRENGPWSQLVSLNNIRICVLQPGVETRLSPHLCLFPVAVPHRNEYSDTLAFLVRGQGKRLFYCPDIDSWDAWDLDLRSLVSDCDIALLDGTFYSADELPGRDMSRIPHHLATDTARRLAWVNCDVRLIHLNHSNPLHAPGPERDWMTAQGLRVGTRGDRWGLD
jgi:pyrroloquinoline quinone biosynthesis protein B